MNQGGGLACCAVCSNQTNRRCARCLSIYYCSTEHQKQDWKRHRSECAPKISKQGSKKDKIDVCSSSRSDNPEERKHLNVEKESEGRAVTKEDGSASESRRLKKSKKKSAKKEGSDTNSDNKQNSIVPIENELVIQSGSEQRLQNDSRVTSGVVYTNRDLNKQSAINYEGSSEQEILSESAQQLSTVEFATTSPNILRSVNRTESKMITTLPSYGPGHTHKEYPEVSLQGSTTCNSMPNNYYTDPSDPWYDICQRVIRDMTRYGVCVLDNFLGKERGLMVRNEVLQMHQSGIFQVWKKSNRYLDFVLSLTDIEKFLKEAPDSQYVATKAGQLVSNPARTEARTVRSDRITWVDGEEPHCYYIKQLISQVDNIVLRANKMPNNGKMGDYIINERTKAMVACYPGSGSHYVKHVDNPNKDGRCITAIYYLNLDWNVQRYGGLLRVFPEGLNHNADIVPIFDRMLFFWSDRRNPHEVQPAFETRYAITLWYFDAQERKEARRHYQERGQPSSSK